MKEILQTNFSKKFIFIAAFSCYQIEITKEALQQLQKLKKFSNSKIFTSLDVTPKVIHSNNDRQNIINQTNRISSSVDYIRIFEFDDGDEERDVFLLLPKCEIAIRLQFCLNHQVQTLIIMEPILEGALNGSKQKLNEIYSKLNSSSDIKLKIVIQSKHKLKTKILKYIFPQIELQYSHKFGHLFPEGIFPLF